MVCENAKQTRPRFGESGWLQKEKLGGTAGGEIGRREKFFSRRREAGGDPGH